MRKEKEELSKLLKEYKTNQIYDIDEQVLLNNRQKDKNNLDYEMYPELFNHGRVYDQDDSDDYDEYDEDEEDEEDDQMSPFAMKYGKQVSPVKPMFNPYQTVIIYYSL